MDKTFFANVCQHGTLKELAQVWKTHRAVMSAAQRYIFAARATQLRLAI